MGTLARMKKCALDNARDVYPVGSKWTNGANVYTIDEVSGDRDVVTKFAVWARLTGSNGEPEMMFLDELENLSPAY